MHHPLIYFNINKYYMIYIFTHTHTLILDHHLRKTNPVLYDLNVNDNEI